MHIMMAGPLDWHMVHHTLLEVRTQDPVFSVPDTSQWCHLLKWWCPWFWDRGLHWASVDPSCRLLALATEPQQPAPAVAALSRWCELPSQTQMAMPHLASLTGHKRATCSSSGATECHAAEKLCWVSVQCGFTPGWVQVPMSSHDKCLSLLPPFPIQAAGA